MEKTVLQTYELHVNVRPAYGTLYKEAMVVLEGKYKRDGIAPLERVLVQLLKLYRTGRYETTLKVWSVKHRYGVTTFLPDRPKLSEPKERITFLLNNKDLLGMPSLPLALVEALNTVRYDLYKKGIMHAAAPSVEELLVAMVCYTAAVESRRWKNRVGLKLLSVER